MPDQPTPRSPQITPGSSSAPEGEPATVPPGDAQTNLPQAASALRAGSAPLQLPALFGRYRLEKLLGKGGMGAVYLAHDSQLDRYVALKIPKFSPDDGDLRERFFREARAAATLQHTNLCAVYDVGEIDGVHYLTMAYIEGKPLSAYIRADKLLPPSQIAGLIRAMAKALQEAHDHGIIHRDLKPANIMINKKKQPVIMDFGLARRVMSQDERLTHSGAIMGTPAYMAPEQVNGDVRAMGPVTDVYALGVILYEMLTGRRPFEGPALGSLMAQIVADPPPPPARFRPDLDPALAAICLRALAKQPADRYLSMKTFAAALEQWLAGESAVKRPTQQPGHLKTPLPVRPAVVAVLDDIDDVPSATLEPQEPPETASRRTKKRSGKKRGLSRTTKTVLAICLTVFVLCILPVGLIIMGVKQFFDEASNRFGEFGKSLEEQKKEQEKLQKEMEKEEKQLQDAMKSWRFPPKDASPESLLPGTVGVFKLTKNESVPGVPDLKSPLPGQKGYYEGPSAAVDLFVFRASELERQTIFKDFQQDFVFKGGFSLTPGGPLIRESSDGRMLLYGRPPASKVAEQYGVFLWDKEGERLYFCRSSTARAPSAFLKEYFGTFGAAPAEKDK